MTSKPGRPSTMDQLREAERVDPERLPEMIRTLRERDPAAYFALIAEAIAEGD